MKTLATLLSIISVSAFNPLVADEQMIAGTEMMSNHSLRTSISADLDTAKMHIGYDIEDEIANLERINQLTSEYLKREHRKHVHRININSRAFPVKNLRKIASE